MKTRLWGSRKGIDEIKMKDGYNAGLFSSASAIHKLKASLGYMRPFHKANNRDTKIGKLSKVLEIQSYAVYKTGCSKPRV